MAESWSGRMLGCRPARRRISLMKRISGVGAGIAFRTFRATWRSCRQSRARYTVAESALTDLLLDLVAAPERDPKRQECIDRRG